MPDEPQKQPDDIQGILSDLDDILSDLGSAGGAAPAPAPSAPKPVEPPKPVAAPKPAEPQIELSPRAGMVPPPPAPKKAEPPKPKASDAKPPLELPAAPPPAPAPAAAAPAAAAPTQPAKDAPPLVPLEIPPNTPKDQIRRVAYIHTASCAEAKAGFAGFLSQAARTISKKPIFLREVLSLEITGASVPGAVFEKARQAQAVAVLAVLEGWPQAKVDELSEVCSRGGILFRSVASGDVQKKSTAVDVIVDMMLLPGEG